MPLPVDLDLWMLAKVISDCVPVQHPNPQHPFEANLNVKSLSLIVSLIFTARHCLPFSCGLDDRCRRLLLTLWTIEILISQVWLDAFTSITEQVMNTASILCIGYFNEQHSRTDYNSHRTVICGHGLGHTTAEWTDYPSGASVKMTQISVANN